MLGRPTLTRYDSCCISFGLVIDNSQPTNDVTDEDFDKVFTLNVKAIASTLFVDRVRLLIETTVLFDQRHCTISAEEG